VLLNMNTDLTKQKCKPCEGGTEPFSPAEIETYQTYLKTPWDVEEVDPSAHSVRSGRIFQIRKKFKFEDFVKAMEFVNKVADIANEEDHHPDIFINYSRVTITLTTHSIGGLSPNDFIVASKIEELN
jgi:4a-hydroxytetrahydrobiopterin dehydratase